MGESGLRVLQIGNRDAFQLEALRGLFERAFADPDHAEASEVLDWCEACVLKPNIGIFVAAEGVELVGLIVGDWSESPWNPTPFVMHAYAEVPGAFDALLEAIREWSISVSGTRGISFVNATAYTDEDYLEYLSKHLEGEPVKSLIRAAWHRREGEE